MSFFEDVIAGLIPGLGGLSDVGSMLFGFFDTVTNGKMWRSLGWLLLGIVLIALSLALWLKTEVL